MVKLNRGFDCAKPDKDYLNLFVTKLKVLRRNSNQPIKNDTV